MEHERIIAWLHQHDIDEDLLDPVVEAIALRWQRIKGISLDVNEFEVARRIVLDMNIGGLDSQVSYLTSFFGAEFLTYEHLKKSLELPDIPD